MKKYYFLIIGFLFFGVASAQIVNIPDANFKIALIANNVDTNNNQEIEVSEALAITELFFGFDLIIYDITGIEYFINLQSLAIDSTNITNLNLSQNINLKVLTFQYHENLILTLNPNTITSLEELRVGGSQFNLIQFNFNQFINLKILNCSSCNLISIDISDLVLLEDFTCIDNQISNLDLTGLINLKELNCSNNQISNLNVTGLINLETINFSVNQISNFNASEFIKLKNFYCSSNQISNLNLSGLINLQSINCSSNQISNLNLTGLINLFYLICANNQLTNLNFNDSIYLFDVDCSNNLLTSLNFDNQNNIGYLDCQHNQISNLNLATLPFLNTIKFSHNQVSSIDISNNKELSYIKCNNNNLTNLDLHGFNALAFLDCSNNFLTNLNLDFSRLDTLNCSNNLLTQLDVSKIASLQLLNCSNNNIFILDVRTSPLLKELKCNSNSLTSLSTLSNTDFETLEFNQNPNLTYICSSISSSNHFQTLVASYGNTNVTITSNCGFPALVFDPVFKQRLLSQFIQIEKFNYALPLDTNNDGEIQQFEANQVVNLSIRPYGSQTDSFYVPNNLGSLLGILNFSNLKTFTCVNNTELTEINLSGLTKLNSLYLYNNVFTSLSLNNLPSLSILSCQYNNLTNISLTELLNLSGLNCNSNQLTNLDVTYLPGLVTLFCDNNLLTSIDVSHNLLLENLQVYHNLLPSIDVSGNSALNTLDCSNNFLSDINVSNNSVLTTLNCSSNFLTSINVSNNSFLWNLYCGNNQLTNVDVSNNSFLNELYCNNNQLTSVDISANLTLKELNCFSNSINSLDVSNNLGLTRLDCSHNQISSIDLSSTLQLAYFVCSNNPITTLDLSNQSLLTGLVCNDNNLLTSLFLKNGSIESTLEFSNNPNLYYICGDDDQLQDIQNKINTYNYTNCNVNSYCSFTPGGTFYTINGKNRYDSNTNGCDASDVAIPNFKLAITDTSLTTGNVIPDLTGNYSLPLQEGTYTLTPVFENTAYFSVTPASATITLPETVNPYIQDFCITANGVHDDLEVSVFPIDVARPGFDASYKIMYKNKGTNAQSGSLNFIFEDAVLDLVTAFPVVTNQTLNNLSWDFTNLLPFESKEIIVTLNVNSPMETPAVNNNDVLAFNSSISGLTDETPLDNLATLNQTVVNSFDPNDKTCLEGDYITPSMIGKYVHYKIRFENTGTFPAQNIVVTDRIDTAIFDISTLQPVNGSHAYTTRITDTNKVEFIFQNIFLPFDDATNDGYIVFKIKTWPTLTLGDELKNTANIFFDYNFPIETNTATTVVANPLASQDFDFETYFNIFPNPAKNLLNISSKQNIQIESINIYNTIGQLILVIPNAKNTKTFDVSNLKSGTYFVKVITDRGASSSKFVKE